MAQYCDHFEFREDNSDSFQFWQGLRGPYYTPHVDAAGNLSWTNNGQLPNPPTQNVSGRGITLTGTCETTDELPDDPQWSDAWAVGTEAPFECYAWFGEWVDLGPMFPPGPPGEDGQGVPTGGTAGQFLKKSSGTDYDAEWDTLDAEDVGFDSSATYSAGTVGKGLNDLKNTLNTLVKEIARPNLLDNWYFVGGGSQKRYGTFPINQKGMTSYSTNGTTNIDRWLSYNTSSLVVESNGVKIVSSGNGFVLTQNIDECEDLLGKTLTATALFASVSGGTAGIRLEIGATVYSGTDLTSGGLTSVTHEVPSNAAGIKVDIRMTEGTTAKLIAIKLEIGSEQTLAYQTQSGWEVIGIPSFSEELAKAQAYYFKATNFAAEYAGVIGTGATLIRFLVPLPCQMVSSATNVTLQPTLTVYFTNSSNASTFAEIGTGKSITFTVSDVKVEPVGVRISLALSAALPSGEFRFCVVEADNITISA